MYGDYSIAGFGDMLLDTVRMRGYTEALRRVITPGSTILDLGCGPGVLSLIACKLGARHVIAADVNDAILLGKPLAEANGYADRIQFHHGSSQDLVLDTPVDVMVSDLRGVLPWFGPHQTSIKDARARLLKPGGIQISQQDQVWAALVSAPKLQAGLLKPWSEGPMELDLTPALPFASNRWKKNYFDPSEILTTPQKWAFIDYTQWDSPHAAGEMAWEIEHDAMAHGVGAWFDATLFDDIGFSNSPESPRAIYGQAYFPWPEEVALKIGDQAFLKLRAHCLDGQYVYTWNTKIVRRSGTVTVFNQSSFNSAPLSQRKLEALAKESAKTS